MGFILIGSKYRTGNIHVQIMCMRNSLCSSVQFSVICCYHFNQCIRWMHGKIAEPRFCYEHSEFWLLILLHHFGQIAKIIWTIHYNKRIEQWNLGIVVNSVKYSVWISNLMSKLMLVLEKDNAINETFDVFIILFQTRDYVLNEMKSITKGWICDFDWYQNQFWCYWRY